MFMIADKNTAMPGWLSWRTRVVRYLLLLSVFLLPWQSRWIFKEELLNGSVFEYGRLSLSLIEILLILVFVLRGRPQLSAAQKKVMRSVWIFWAASAVSLYF